MYFIGIAGRSGSGKTRVAAEVVRLCPRAGVLATDAYYRDLVQMSAAEREAVNFDAPGALDWELLVTHLVRLHAGASVSVPRYDFSSHVRLPQTSLLVPCDILILEGLFALFDHRVREFLNLAVFIDVAEEECLRRRIDRDTGSRGRTEASARAQWERDVAPMYARHVAPTKAYAELMLDGTAAPADSARAILREVGQVTNASEKR